MNRVNRTDSESSEDQSLAPYACRSANSRGREVAERPDALRTEFQRDRDRILHCSAFRKLEYKTQVYVTHEGDFFRTRLTHTLEVAQIGRTLARALAINQDLTEAIALAHDLGHTPFGHTGEAELNVLLAQIGGFEHNAQSLRVVEVLEERFIDRPGLNLTWEVREGIAHHSKSTAADVMRFRNSAQPSLEAQLVDLADEIAYHHHDLDDALGMGILEPRQLREVPWLARIWQREQAALPAGAPVRYIRNRMLGGLMDTLIHDALEHSLSRLNQEGIGSPQAVRERTERLIAFSPTMREGHEQLRAFLMQAVYRHPTTLRWQTKAAGYFRKLFQLYREQSELLPPDQQARVERWGLLRVLGDYLSGMTDRHCLEEFMDRFQPGFAPTPPAPERGLQTG